MQLEQLKNDWESLAERDALNAILTDESKSAGGWDISEFMATGEIEIDTVMRHLAGLRCTPDFNGTALDFGCGVGRLTQAMAGRFASCIGIDISAQMIRKADSFNHYAHCRYMVNTDVHLPFTDESFTFLYSNIVLQHVPSRFATEYLREFVRVLSEGGVLVFGVQDSFAAPNLSSWLIRMRHVLHLRSTLKALAGRGGDMRMHCLPERVVRRCISAARIVDIQLTNTAARDFNGKLVYLTQPPSAGYVGKQYCVVK
jgi:trans-aconitate methyltransferase